MRVVSIRVTSTRKSALAPRRKGLALAGKQKAKASVPIRIPIKIKISFTTIMFWNSKKNWQCGSNPHFLWHPFQKSFPWEKKWS